MSHLARIQALPLSELFLRDQLADASLIFVVRLLICNFQVLLKVLTLKIDQ